MSEWKVTDFEWNETVFVPAGDGEPAQWKPFRDLTVDEFARHAQGLVDAADQNLERVRRYRALVDEAGRRLGGRNGHASSVLSREEMAELSALLMTTDAWEREFDRRQAAIDRDMAAGRYRVMNSGGGDELEPA